MSHLQTEFDNTSILDPHLSVLALLQRNNSGTSVSNSRCTPRSTTLGETAESWNEIQRSELQRCTSQTNTVGILSSSDTSEEEEIDTKNSSPSPHRLLLKKNQLLHPKSPLKFDSTRDKIISLPNVAIGSIINANNSIIEEDDSITLTKSIVSSSSSFVMPKLSLSARETRLFFKVLILGRLGLQFYRSIPTQYQYIFQLPRTHDTNEFINTSGLLIIIEESRELVNMLNRISQTTMDKTPIIVISLDTDNFIQIKNVINPFLRKNLISLLYPPLVFKDKRELTKMFNYVSHIADKFNYLQKKLIESQYDSSSSSSSSTVSSSSSFSEFSSGSSGSFANRKLKKLQYQNGKKITKYIQSRDQNSKKKKKLKRTRFPNSNKKKKTKNSINKWIIWGVSLTIGVGVGYCISYFKVLTWITVPVQYLKIISSDVSKLDAAPETAGSSSAPQSLKRLLMLTDSEFDPDSHSFFFKSLNFIKDIAKDFNQFIKSKLVKPLSCLDKLSTSPIWYNGFDADNQSKILALGYILV